MFASEIVNKIWNLSHVLRDNGAGYADYVEQTTYLIFLKVANERENAAKQIHISNKYAWTKAVKLDGDDLQPQYRVDEAIDLVLKQAELPADQWSEQYGYI